MAAASPPTCLPGGEEPFLWGAWLPGSILAPSCSPTTTSKPAWEDLSFTARVPIASQGGGGGRTLLQVLPPGAADALRLHLQPRASSFQRCSGRVAGIFQHSPAGFGSC